MTYVKYKISELDSGDCLLERLSTPLTASIHEVVAEPLDIVHKVPRLSDVEHSARLRRVRAFY
jgi:hypothetical protein